MLVYAFFGGAGSGKTTVAKYIQAHYSAAIINADQLGHQLLTEQTMIEKIVTEFGADILETSSSHQKELIISRFKLGKIVFKEKAALERLNQLIHPAINQRICQEINHLKLEGRISHCLVEGALVHQLPSSQQMSKRILIDAPIALRLERLVNQRGIEQSRALAILRRQPLPVAYRRQAEFILSTENGVEPLKPTLDCLF